MCQRIAVVHDAQPSTCRHVTSALFFCYGKIYPLPRLLVSLPGTAEVIPSPVKGGEASPEQREGTKACHEYIKGRG